MSDRILEDRYELGRRIGGGGMAEVVEAYDRKLDRRVAVKLLRAGSADPRARERFLNEAQVAARFTHPNVVTLFDVGEWDGEPYLVMELVDGRTLAEILADRGALPVRQSLAIADSVLAALAAAHAQGLVHRDVKPANILIGRNGRVKLADFGIAKAMQAAATGLTATGQLIGTPAYLSPEQVDGADVTPRTDLYSVGVVLYEMLTGAPPFVGDQPLAVALAHRHDPVPPIEAARPDVPPALAASVTRALDKDPERRFASADEMRAALGDAARSEPVTGPPTMATTRPDATRTIPAPEPTAPRRSRRSRRGAWATVLWLLAAAALGAGVALLALRTDSGPRRGLSSTVTFPSVATPTLPTTTTTTIPPPQTIDDLIALIGANPAAYGDKGQDLYNRLVELQKRPDPHGRRATELLHDIESWVSDGKLDPVIGTLATQILQSYLASGQ